MKYGYSMDEVWIVYELGSVHSLDKKMVSIKLAKLFYVEPACIKSNSFLNGIKLISDFIAIL